MGAMLADCPFCLGHDLGGRTVPPESSLSLKSPENTQGGRRLPNRLGGPISNFP